MKVGEYGVVEYKTDVSHNQKLRVRARRATASWVVILEIVIAPLPSAKLFV